MDARPLAHDDIIHVRMAISFGQGRGRERH